MKNGLTTEHWILKKWLESHFISGKYWTIEEICERVVDVNGKRIFELNTNPRIHDKCLKLSSMVRDINWNVNQGFKIIIKDKKGGIKLAETQQEFNDWKDKEIKKLQPRWQYLNNLKWKADRDGTIPLLNQAMNPNDKVVNVYAKEPIIVYNGQKMLLSEFMRLGATETFNRRNGN